MNLAVLIAASVITVLVLAKDTYAAVTGPANFGIQWYRLICGCVAGRDPSGDALPFPRWQSLVPLLVPARKADADAVASVLQT